jgi:hypothetical protein
MPRLFHRIISFEVEGEIYDNSSRAEDIIKNYDWRVQHLNDNLVITAHSREKNGRIVNLTKIPKVFRSRKVDTNYYIV